MFCPRCGASNRPHARFCRACGSVMPDQHHGQGMKPGQPMPPPPPSPGFPQPPTRRPFPTVLVLVLLALSGIGIWWLLGAGDGGSDSDAMTLGQYRQEESEDISPEGGSIVIDDPDSDIDGFVIDIPEGAYPDERTFEIGTTPVEKHELGSLFNPVTPLITIDNGHEFADAPMTLTIPVDLDEDEFALAFYYDRETGELEAMPLLGEDSESITVMTYHFSDFIVSKVRTDRIVDDIDTGFKPGMDDIVSPNNGTVIRSGGHCAGQAVAMITYFANKKAGRIGWDKNLYFRFDNNDKGDTPFFYEDDALIQRFSSAMQAHVISNWDNTNNAYLKYRVDFGVNDRNTYHAFAYAMRTTGMPQLIFIAHTESFGKTDAEKAKLPDSKKGAHAMVVYGIEDSRLLIADPNYPGDRREIRYSHGSMLGGKMIADGSFIPYNSGPDAASAGSSIYDLFGFMGTNAVINKKVVTDYWLDAMENGGKNLIDPLFPADPELFCLNGKDANGVYRTVRMTPEMTLSPEAIRTADGTPALYLAPESSDAKAQYRLFLGEKLMDVKTSPGMKNSVYLACVLQPGLNDVGVLWEMPDGQGGFDLVNFYRFRVTVSDVMLSVDPAAAEIAAGDIVNYTTVLEGLVADPVYLWQFGDGTKDLSGKLPEMPHMYEKAGTYTGQVSVAEADKPDSPLATATFLATVGEAAATPAPEAGGGLGGQWKITYTFTDECRHDGGISGMSHSLPFENANHLNVPFTWEGTLAENAFAVNGSQVVVTVALHDGYTFTGTMSGDGTTIEGTFKGTWQDTHWGTGTFTMVKIG